MKNLIITIAVAATLIGTSAFSSDDKPNDKPTTREQVVTIADAFMPSNFDTSSDAFIVISGLFSNGCYRYKTATVSNVGERLHEVRALATVSEGMCLMVLVPFSKEVQLGKLTAGEHSVRFINGDGTYWEKTLNID
jgi:hypothetical protein